MNFHIRYRFSSKYSSKYTRQYDYEGCGCAGSSETRVTDELGYYTTTKTDALGRLVEAIEPPLVGEGYYSKANYFYDVMDRPIRIESYGEYNPSTGITQTQIRYFSYDGYGRLAQENTSEGGVVTFTHTANDLPLTKTDARNITTTFTHNTRGLLTGIGYSDGTPGITYTYDDFGARQTMTDGEGGVSYIYNSFRQLESETRTFTALTGKQHTLNYTYNLVDQPKSVNYVVSQSSGSLIPPELGEPSRDTSTWVATLMRPDIPTAGMAVETGGKRGVESFDGAKAVVSASALILGQRARWRPSSAETISPRVIKTAMRRVIPPSAAQDLSISGRVATSQGAGIQGVNISVTGGPFGPASATTDSNGNYTVSQLWPGYNYTVTPSKAGYTFNPQNRVYNQLNENVTDADFTGSLITYAISGRVTNSQGTGISQVTVTLSGTHGGTTSTNGNGDYSFTNLTSGGSYTVTASKTGYSFTPTNRSYTNLSANVTNAHFTIAPLPPPPFTAFNKTVNLVFASNFLLPVGELGYANAWGLYDMHGNVYEWRLDHGHANYIGAPSDGSAWTQGGDDFRGGLRGGRYRFIAEAGRSSARAFYSKNLGATGFGLRVVAEITPSIGDGKIVATSAANYAGISLAPDSIAALFGANLATDTKAAGTLPLPITLAGASVIIKDSRGNEYASPLFFASPNQINFQIPAGLALGAGLVSVVTNGDIHSTGTLEISSVSPGVFTSDASGAGLAAALALRVKSDGELVYEPIFQFDPASRRFVAVPIDLNNPAEQVFLLLFGTGMRNRSSLASVTASIGDATAEVLFVGAQGGFAGLDQCNLRLPNALAGRGEVNVVFTVDGKAANAVKAYIK
ncbi:MAG TPA: carboxypeptidase regulatory-like domain-containing protein [Blastocatellia bacterium]|nr:carboxypeptidase regulatory-like domain-containing protein [Blastocatellia bacterium]